MDYQNNSEDTQLPKILHIFNDPKFSSGYFEFLLRNQVSLRNHYLFHYRCNNLTCNDYGMRKIYAQHFFSPVPNLLMLPLLLKSDKIIIHSLASPFLLIYLFCFPFLCKKCYWAIWGKDLYFYKSLKKITFYHRIYEYFRKKVIKNITKIIGFSRRDYELALEWYGCKAERFENFMYPSNCYKSIPTLAKSNDTITILVGNSADPSNNHIEAFKLLKSIANENIKIIAPLSYGSKSYAHKIIQRGHSIFGEKFQPISKLLPLDEYLKLLANVDIGFFTHDRQQAMGNIITLLGMKKRVYIRKNITTWGTLTEMGIKLYNIYKFNLYNENKEVLESNSEIIKNYFSEANLLYQWNNVFND